MHENWADQNAYETLQKVRTTSSVSIFLFARMPSHPYEERAGDIKHSKADPSKFNQLGFKPQYSIEQALLETITFYENELLVN